MSTDPSDTYAHILDWAAIGDGRAITLAILALADEVRALRQALEAPVAPVAPGPCWHDSGVNIPMSDTNYRCELKAGHLGAHECSRGNGSAVWPAEETPR